MEKNRSKILGQKLLKARQRTGLSQFALAVCMGWQGTAPIISIEKGRRLPNPRTIERLADCLNIDEPDRSFLHGIAGYMPIRRLPRLENVKRVLAPVAEELRNYPYPAYILDYQFAFWAINPATAALIGGNPDAISGLLRSFVSIFDIVFDSRLGIRSSLRNLETLDLDQIRRFKFDNLLRRHEPFYLRFLPKMEARLAGEDYQGLLRAWESVKTDVQIAPRKGYGGNRAYVEFSPDGETVLKWELTIELIVNLPTYFDLVRYSPVAEGDNEARCREFCSSFIATDVSDLNLWEVTDPTALLDKYEAEIQECVSWLDTETPLEIETLVNLILG